MTVHQTLKHIKSWHHARLNQVEKAFVTKMLDGLDGMGEVSDLDVKEYLTPSQEKFVREIGKRFLITKDSK